MRIVFFGTAPFAVPILQSLAEHHTVSMVVTTPDAKVGRKHVLRQTPVADTADQLSVPVIKPATLKNNQDFFQELKSQQADIFIVVAYGKILPSEIIELPPLKTLNVHYSLLPKYRGASPVQFALWNGDSETGSTIMLMDTELDHGPILSQESLAIDPHDTFISLGKKLCALSAPLLLNTIKPYIAGTLAAQEQNHDQATYTKIISKQDGKIDWSQPADKIYNQYRAFVSWPGIWTTWNGIVLKILKCRPDSISASPQPPGTVLENGSVVCGDSSILQIEELQIAGKQATGIKNFQNGYKNFVGSKLGVI